MTGPAMLSAAAMIAHLEAKTRFLDSAIARQNMTVDQRGAAARIYDVLKSDIIAGLVDVPVTDVAWEDGHEVGECLT